MPLDDFDFLEGHFLVRHQRLKERLAGSDEWLTFDMKFWGQPIMGRAALLDQMGGRLGDRELWGLTLRLYDPDRDQWSLYWADTWQPGLRPPVIGRFKGRVGEFFGDDEEGGVPVRARFRWSDITADTARWEQAFSVDSGATWETNWIMEFERLSCEVRP
ncbi:MAG: hypothetical protein ABFS14_07465 [Gemmatimonadota bacterium]